MTAMQQEVTLLPLHCNKICKTILTHSAIHDTLYRKSHQFCRKVQNGEDLFPMKIFTAPQHIRSILPPIHPTKFFACLAGWYFSLRELYLENFMSRPNVIPTFRQRRCTNRGRNFVRSKRRSTYTSSGTLYLFLHLNNSETFVENAF